MGARRLPALLLTGLLSLGLMPWAGGAALAHSGADDAPGHNHDHLDDKGGTRPDGVSDDAGNDDNGGTRKTKDRNKGRTKDKTRDRSNRKSDDKGSDDKGGREQGQQQRQRRQQRQGQRRQGRQQGRRPPPLRPTLPIRWETGRALCRSARESPQRAWLHRLDRHQTLEIVEEFPDRFRVVALTAGNNLDLLITQICRHAPEVVALADADRVLELRRRLEALEPAARPQRLPELVGGPDGLCTAAAWPTADLVVTGIVGCAGLLPTLAAIRAGKDLALANKETLIAAGPVVLPELERSGSRLLPADSEHSAIFQCLQGTPYAETARLSTGQPTPGLRRIQLTASGGAFRDWDAADLARATVADATSHPNWSMGRKITVDSASLMNKGLEVIEAHYLFGLDFDHIEIVIHPQSIIHSMVELADSSVLAQLGWPDMKLPILYCLSWPERLDTPWRRSISPRWAPSPSAPPIRRNTPAWSWPTRPAAPAAPCRR